MINLSFLISWLQTFTDQTIKIKSQFGEHLMIKDMNIYKINCVLLELYS